MPTSTLLAIFVFAFAISIGAVVSPGPVTAAIVSEAPRRGWRVGPLVATGHIALELVFIILIAIGLSAILAKPSIQQIIAIAGSILLLYMGISYIWSVLKGRASLPESDSQVQPRHQRSLIGLGIVTTISNPFWYAWWATIVPGYLGEVSDAGIISIAAFYLGHISADYLWDTFLSVTVSAGRRWLTEARYKLLILITGGFMVYLGILFAMQGFGI
jgi:threonine/homoserine/homoserine lactone efflux protein